MNESRQLLLGIRLRDASTFRTYYGGRNQSVVTALQLPTGQPPVCIWVHGPNSVGKSHLLQAVCAQASTRGELAVYLPMRELESAGPEVLAGYDTRAVVAVDDIELIADHAEWEGALFRLYRQLEEHGGRIIAASDLPPSAVPFKLRDLASRMNGSLVLALHMLDDDEQLAALQLRAHVRGFELPADAGQYLLRRLPRDMESLCAFLDELDEASLLARRRLSLRFVRDIWEQDGGGEAESG